METFLTDILFSEYPNDSGYYGSGDTEVDCYDDEDCVTEGSGSGGKVRGHEDSEDGEGSGGYGEDEEEEEDSFEPVWPPWVTSSPKPPHHGDVVLAEDTDQSTMRPPVIVRSGASGTGAQLSAARSLLWLAALVTLLVTQLGRS